MIFPTNTNHTRCIWDRFLRGPGTPKGVLPAWFPAFSSAKTHPFPRGHGSVLMEFPLQRHWQPVRSVTGWWCNGRREPRGYHKSNPAMPIWKSLKGTEFEFPYIDSFKSLFWRLEQDTCVMLLLTRDWRWWRGLTQIVRFRLEYLAEIQKPIGDGCSSCRVYSITKPQFRKISQTVATRGAKQPF